MDSSLQTAQVLASYAAVEYMRCRVEAADLLTQSKYLLGATVAGIGFAIGGVIQTCSAFRFPWIGGAVASVVWLALCAGVTLWTCVFVLTGHRRSGGAGRERHVRTASAGTDLWQHSRAAEEEIDALRNRNVRVARWLNRCNHLAIATPVIFIVGAVVGC